MKKTAKDKIYIKKLDIGEHEHVPSKLHNPKLVKSFEFFMNLYALPRVEAPPAMNRFDMTTCAANTGFWRKLGK